MKPLLILLALSLATPAVAGWYLLEPPEDVNDSSQPNRNAPLSAWELVQPFDTIRECEAAQHINFRTTRQDTDNNAKTDSPFMHEWRLRYLRFVGAQQCIASDDPRLKP